MTDRFELSVLRLANPGEYDLILGAAVPGAFGAMASSSFRRLMDFTARWQYASGKSAQPARSDEVVRLTANAALIRKSLTDAWPLGAHAPHE